MRRHLLLTALLVPCALGTTPALADVVPSVTLDGPSAQITAVSRVDVAADGTAALAWVKNGDVWASRYAGGAWSTPGMVADTTAPTRPVVAAAAGGRTVVAYTDGGSAWAVTSPGTGAAFGGPGKIGDGPGWIDIDSAADGTTYATGATGGGNPDVFAWRQSAAGWDAVGAGALDANQALQAGGTNDHQPHIAAYPGGAVMLWGEGDDASADEVFFRRLTGTDAGTATQASIAALQPLAGGQAAGESRMLSVAVTPAGDAWLAFRQDIFYGMQNRPRVIVRPLTGATLGDAQVADALGSAPPEGAEYPRLALDGAGGGVLATPMQLSGGTAIADLAGGTWTAFRAETTISTTVTAPDAAIGAEGTATVVWTHTPTIGSAYLTSRHRLGGTWAAERPLSDAAKGAVFSTSASAAADAGGTAHVTFMQGAADKTVEVARLDGPPAPPAPPAGDPGGGAGGGTPPAGAGTPPGGGGAPGPGPGVIVEPVPRFAGATKVTLTGGTLRVRDGRARVTVRNANAFAVKAALRLRVAGRTLRATATLAPNARRTLRVTVPKKVRNSLGRSGRPAKLTLSVTDPAGTTRTVKATATLRLPAKG